MHDLSKCDRDYHNLRADLMELRLWAEAQLNTELDRQYIAEHMTEVIDALLAHETPPHRLF